jgi:repressor LexA
MSRPATLLESLCSSALALGADSIEVEYKDGLVWVFAQKQSTGIGIANYPSSSAEGKKLRQDLYSLVRKPRRTVLLGQPCLLKVRVFDSFGEDAFEVAMHPAPRADAGLPVSFTAKQGQYLAYIFHYTKLHRVAPAESDLQNYFRVSPPSVHQMVVTLERNGLIERIPRRARSIRLLVPPEQLPPLE